MFFSAYLEVSHPLRYWTLASCHPIISFSRDKRHHRLIAGSLWNSLYADQCANLLLVAKSRGTGLAPSRVQF